MAKVFLDCVNILLKYSQRPSDSSVRVKRPCADVGRGWQGNVWQMTDQWILRECPRGKSRAGAAVTSPQHLQSLFRCLYPVLGALPITTQEPIHKPSPDSYTPPPPQTPPTSAHLLLKSFRHKERERDNDRTKGIFL